MTMSVELRAATLADVDVLTYQRDAMFLDMGYAADEVNAASDPARTWLVRALADDLFHGILAMVDGAVVGGLGIVWLDLPPNMHTRNERRAFVINVYVAPAHRRHGIARRLLETALAECERRGVDVITLQPSDDGRGLYESAGFTPSGELRLHR